jgi:hypothetical protein
MTNPVGPLFAGGFQQIKAGQYELLFLPDLHNDELQREGKPPVYYWMPGAVRLARMNVDTGPAKFHMIHFLGVQSGDTTVGVTGTREVAGGVITFTTTAAPPAGELEASQNQLAEMFKGSDDRFWGWRTPVAPAFRPMPVMACTTTLSNLSPKADGSIPSAGAPAKAGGLRELRMVPSVIAKAYPRTVREGSVDTSSNLDPWFIDLQGQGDGSINLLGETAYSGLMGSYPAAILWDSFHGGTGAIIARQDYKLKFWAPTVDISIHGNWDKIFEHFSAAVSAHYLWASADIQVEINNMRTNGTLEVKVEIDPTIFGSDTAAAAKFQEQIDKRTDLVLQKFTEEAQKMIFEPAAPKVDPAHADSGSGLWGVGFALRYRRDDTKLELKYHEKREMAYIQNHTISSSLGGFIDEIRADPEAEKRYFTTLYLDDWDRKVTRTVKPICNWLDQTRKYVGEPVSFLSFQMGYPDTNGQLQWTGRMFQASDPPDTVYQPAVARKKESDVSNPPADWKPDITFVKRKVHFAEPPNEAAYPFARIFIERNEVDLDPGPNGTPTDEINLEVRAESAGKLDVGPVALNVDLDNSKQIVEVAFQCDGKTLDGNDRNITKFQWLYNDQAEPRFWAIYTGQLDFVPRFRYQVRVIVKGSITTKGMEWTGPWVATNGNGPLMIRVPTPEDEGVTVTREFPLSTAAAGQPPAPAVPAPHAPGHPPSKAVPAVPRDQPAGAQPAGTQSTGTPGLPPPRTRAPAGSGTQAYGYRVGPATATREGPTTAGATSGTAAGTSVSGWSTRDPSERRRVPARQE